MINAKLFLWLMLAAVIASGCSRSERWYTDDRAERGKALFEKHCTSCHMEGASGAADWKTPDKEGSYPPPPLDGRAHSWHHSMEVLTNIIKEGGKSYKGKMPSFKEELSDEEISSLIAYFQSLWSDEIYKIWEKRDRDSKLN